MSLQELLKEFGEKLLENGVVKESRYYLNLKEGKIVISIKARGNKLLEFLEETSENFLANYPQLSLEFREMADKNIELLLETRERLGHKAKVKYFARAIHYLAHELKQYLKKTKCEGNIF